MTYENNPSIIWKRTSSKAGCVNYCNNTQTPEAKCVIHLDNLKLPELLVAVSVVYVGGGRKR